MFVAPHTSFEILNLNGYGISREGAQLLSESLHSSTTLRELSLSWARLEDKDVCCLAKALSVNNHLEKLVPSDNRISCESAQLLSKLLHTNTTLRELELGGTLEMKRLSVSLRH